MFYTIYKITNEIDGKIYIGKHQTKDLDDGYMGSGKHLRRAIDKYGIENFDKEILHIFDNEDEMNTKEAELVTDEFVKEDTNYNLCPGGQGGWGYVIKNRLHNSFSKNKKSHEIAMKRSMDTRKKLQNDETWSKKKSSNMSIGMKKYFAAGNEPSFKGKKHTEETKQKMRKPKNQGKKNSQYGTMWITNGSENKKIKKIDNIPEGWYKGRKMSNGAGAGW